MVGWLPCCNACMEEGYLVTTMSKIVYVYSNVPRTKFWNWEIEEYKPTGSTSINRWTFVWTWCLGKKFVQYGVYTKRTLRRPQEPSSISKEYLALAQMY